MNKIIALTLTLLSFWNEAHGLASPCAPIEALIRSSEARGFDIYLINYELREFSKDIGQSVDLKEFDPSGEASIERIGRSKFEMKSKQFATDRDSTRRQFRLDSKQGECFVTNIVLPDHNEREENYRVILYEGGILLNVDTPTASLLIPRE